MKKVLFIDYFFPPLLWGWRAATVARYFAELGWQPVVICADENVSYDKDYSFPQELLAGIEVHRVGHREPSERWNYIRSELRIGFDFPDYYKTWIRPAYQKAKNILQRDEIDLIYNLSPIFTTALVALKLKKEFNTPWVIDFRDGWSANDFLNLHYDRAVRRPLRELLKFRVRRGEGAIMKLADKAIVTSWRLKRELCELHGIREKKVEVVNSGYDESVFKGLKACRLFPDQLTIVFLGGIYQPYKEMFLQFDEVVHEINKDTKMVFIGRGAAAVHKMNMPNSTCILHIPRAQAHALALGGDFLLLVMPYAANRWMIPAKVYTYLRLGKPILALVPEEGDAARVVREAKAGFILSFNPEEMKRQLKEIFGRWRKGEFMDFQPDREYIKQFEQKKLTEQIVKVFNEVVH